MRSTLRDPRCLLLALVASLSIACLISRRSEEFACTTTADCPPGRGCSEGVCLAPECPAGCTCSTLLPDGSGYADCTIDCSGNRCRDDIIECPAGMACTFRCDNNEDCERVDCSKAASCVVECSGVNSCDEGVVCGPGPCQVTCGGTGSCGAGVSCGASCSCNVSCNGTSSCGTPAMCPDAACASGSGCTSGGTCNRCS